VHTCSDEERSGRCSQHLDRRSNALTAQGTVPSTPGADGLTIVLVNSVGSKQLRLHYSVDRAMCQSAMPGTQAGPLCSCDQQPNSTHTCANQRLAAQTMVGMAHCCCDCHMLTLCCLHLQTSTVYFAMKECTHLHLGACAGRQLRPNQPVQHVEPVGRTLQHRSTQRHSVMGMLQTHRCCVQGVCTSHSSFCNPHTTSAHTHCHAS
jgi:hypothetical protein